MGPPSYVSKIVGYRQYSGTRILGYSVLSIEVIFRYSTRVVSLATLLYSSTEQNLATLLYSSTEKMETTLLYSSTRFSVLCQSLVL